MSLGQRVSSRTLETAVNNAWSKGVVIVAAAGNAGTQAKIYPGAYPNVIAVAATDNRDAKASFSTYGQLGGYRGARSQRLLDVPEPPVRPRDAERPVLGLRRRQRHLDVLADRRRNVAALVWSTPAGTANTSVRDKVESTADRYSWHGHLLGTRPRERLRGRRLVTALRFSATVGLGLERLHHGEVPGAVPR